MTGSCRRLKQLKANVACSTAVRASSDTASSGRAPGAGTARGKVSAARPSAASSAGFASYTAPHYWSSIVRARDVTMFKGHHSVDVINMVIAVPCRSFSVQARQDWTTTLISGLLRNKQL